MSKNMSAVYHYLMAYKSIHPIRWWVILIGLTGSVCLALYVFRLFRGKASGHSPGKQGSKNIGTRKRRNQSSEKRSGRFFEKPVFLVTAAVVTLIIALGSAGSRLNIDLATGEPIENLSVSSAAYPFGIDISHYQGKIDWEEMQTSGHPIEFIFIRATMGADGVDAYFAENWQQAKQLQKLRGAYHYYRPHENSLKQFENYRSQVTLERGDFIPILDIEQESMYGRENLVKGVLNWLKLAEQEYGVKPMIYTGLTFYQDILKGQVDGYPLWIAAYSGKHRVADEEWTFHQFTEKVRVRGIGHWVDGNDFNGSIEALRNMCIQ